MKRTKLLSLLVILGFFVVGAAFTVKAQKLSNKFKTWEISEGQSGGIAGMIKSYSLDSKGNLIERDGSIETTKKIDETSLQEIVKLLEELKLPRTRTRIVKGDRIYDGVYGDFTIRLDGKVYKVEGNSFYKEKQVVLSASQKKTLDKLKSKLAEIIRTATIETETDPSSKVDNAKTEQTESSIVIRDSTAPLDPAKQKMVFRYEYRNNARRFQDEGWYMDEQGRVYKFSYDRVPDSQNKNKFKLIFKVAPTLIAQISPEILTEKRKLLKAVEKGKYTERQAANDAGTGTVSAFFPNARTGEYREVKLTTRGDYEGNNSAAEADVLLKWFLAVVPDFRIMSKVGEL